MAFVPVALRPETRLQSPKRPRICAQHVRRSTPCMAEAVPGSSAAASAAATSEMSTSGFRAWAALEKVLYPHIDIAQFGALRGMRATSSLVRSGPVMSVPASAVLQTSTLDSGRSPLEGLVCDESWKTLTWYARLALKLYAQKQSREWGAWTDLLPTRFDTPFHWPEADLNELQSPQLAQAVYRQRRAYRRIYDDLAADSRNSVCRAMSYEDFVWCVECVRSRAFAGPQEVAPFKARFQLVLFAMFNTFTWPSLHLLDWDKALNGGLTAILALILYDLLFPKILKTVQNVELRRYALAPGIDFLNHTSDVSAACSVAYEYFLDRFVVRAQQDYSPGEQVLISYGAQSNDSLLQYYGFVDSQNPEDEYLFGSAAERLLKVIPGTLCIQANGYFSEKTMTQISDGFIGGKKEIRKVLAELCRAELTRFNTTLEEDEEIVQTADLSRVRELAIRYRIGKKRLLLQAAQHYE